MKGQIQRISFIRDSALSLTAISLLAPLSLTEKAKDAQKQLFLYNLSNNKTIDSYDEAMVVACIQGLVNRRNPVVYVNSENDNINKLKKIRPELDIEVVDPNNFFRLFKVFLLRRTPP